MSKYKEIMRNKGIMQKEVLDNAHRVDPRVDKPLLSKIVNDVCLPTPPVLASVCKTLGCEVLDIYDPREIALAPAAPPSASTVAALASSEAVATDAERKRKHRREAGVYNLTVEVARSVADRVFAPEALRKLGYLNKTDFVRQKLAEAAKLLDAIEAKEKAADKAGGGN